MKINLPDYIFKHLYCFSCGREQLVLRDFGGGIGIFYCAKCGRWYPYWGGVVEILPDQKIDWAYRKGFWDATERQRRENRIAVSFDSAFTKLNALDKRHGFSDHLSESYDSFMWETPFWQRVESYFVSKWLSAFAPLKREGVLFEPGCGSGRISNRFARAGLTVVGLDITHAMIKKAQQNAVEEGLAGRVLYFIADAEHLPFGEGVFDGCFFAGFLHHLDEPLRGLKEIRRVLKRGSRIFGMDNHKSSARWVFDLLMKVSPLWKEEGGTHQTISVPQLKAWAGGSGFEFSALPYCFVPPHLYRVAGRKAGDSIFDWTNKLFRKNKFLRRIGGLIDIEGKAL